MQRMVRAVSSMALVGLLAVGCGGGGDPADPGGGSAFTPADALVMTVAHFDSASFYVTWTDDSAVPAVEVQETYTFGPASGRTFTFQLHEDRFVGDALVGSDGVDGTATLAADGRSLTVTIPGAQADFYLVQDLGGGAYTMLGVEGADTWDDTWYASPPLGWKTTSAPLAFSPVMFDAATYYLTWIDDTVVPNETVQETWRFGPTSGGVSSVDVSQAVYAGGAPVIQALSGTATLAADGSSLTVTGSGFAVTFTLVADLGDGSYVFQGTDGVDTWTDTWFTTPPAGWLP